MFLKILRLEDMKNEDSCVVACGLWLVFPSRIWRLIVFILFLVSLGGLFFFNFCIVNFVVGYISPVLCLC